VIGTLLVFGIFGVRPRGRIEPHDYGAGNQIVERATLAAAQGRDELESEKAKTESNERPAIPVC
jgi:hypothetical protein